jgi:hypothetical protein
MEWMLRFSLVTLFAAVALAQAPDKPPAQTPPPEVDQALRERMKQFYDLQVQGQYRKSEAFIAEDTKDWFYTISKPRYKSFQVDHIEYNDDFTQAKAMVWVERYFNAPGFPPDMAVRGLTPSTWKLENGLWVWYEDQSAPIRLPWGDITPAPDAKAADGPAAPHAMPPGISGGPANLAALIGNKVKADQTSVTLKSGGSAQVTFANSALGPMTLKVDAKPTGVTVEPLSSDVTPNGKQTLTLRAAKGANAGVVRVRIEQTGEIIPIAVEIK